MRKALLLVMASLMIASALPVAQAEDAEDDDKKFQVTGGFRVRYDRLENYFDFDDDESDRFSLWPYRALVGVSGELAENVDVVLQVQNFGSWGNQSPVQGLTFPPFQDFDGDGNAGGSRTGETALYEAKIVLNKIGGTNANVTIGRQEYEFGSKVILGNEPFYNGTVFDGLRGAWASDNFAISGFFYHVAERNDAVVGDFTSDDADMYGVVGSYGIPGRLKSDVDAYLIRYTDRLEDAFRPNFITFGGRWGRTVDTKEDARELGFDWNLEIAFQRGEAHDPIADTEFDLGGFLTYDWLGFNIPTANHLHRIYGSYLYQSGDDDVTDAVDPGLGLDDDDIKGWIPLFPTTHGLFGNADWFDSNFAQNEASIQAYSLGYSLDCKDGKHRFGARVWKFEPVEDEITFDDGTGAVTFDVDSYGNEYDITYDYRYSRHVTLGTGIAILDVDDGLSGVGNPQDKVSRFWGSVDVRF